MLTKDKFFDTVGYKPHKGQVRFHKDTHKKQLIAGGERAGKSESSAMDAAYRIITGGPQEEYWLVAADYARTRAEWGYLEDVFSHMGVLKDSTKRLDPGEMLVGFPGTPPKECITIHTKSASDPLKLAATAPKGILGCEFSQVDYETYQRCWNRLAEKDGWFIMSGSFESSLGWYAEKYNLWQNGAERDAISFSLPTWENSYIFPGGRNDPKLKQRESECSPDYFMERFGGKPCPPSGGVFTRSFSNSIHVHDELAVFNPDLPVYIWIDPGYVHASVVEAVHIVDNTVYIFDEVYVTGLVTGGPNGIIELIKQERPWFSAVKYGVVDMAGTQRRAEGPSVAKIWRDEGGISLRSNKVGINEGIEQLKRFLMPHPVTSKPKLYVNSTCKGFISECGGDVNPLTKRPAVYKYKTNTDGEVTGVLPIDANNDAVKAVIYGLWDYFGPVGQRNKPAGTIRRFISHGTSRRSY